VRKAAVVLIAVLLSPQLVSCCAAEPQFYRVYRDRGFGIAVYVAVLECGQKAYVSIEVVVKAERPMEIQVSYCVYAGSWSPWSTVIDEREVREGELLHGKDLIEVPVSQVYVVWVDVQHASDSDYEVVGGERRRAHTSFAIAVAKSRLARVPETWGVRRKIEDVRRRLKILEEDLSYLEQLVDRYRQIASLYRQEAEIWRTYYDAARALALYLTAALIALLAAVVYLVAERRAA